MITHPLTVEGITPTRSEGLDLLNRRRDLWKLIQPVVKKLPDQAAFGAADRDGRPIDPLHQIDGSFERNKLLRIVMNVNCHAVITRDNTVLTLDKTPL